VHKLYLDGIEVGMRGWGERGAGAKKERQGNK